MDVLEGGCFRAAAVRSEREFIHRDFPNRSVTMARRIGSTSLAMVLCTAGLGAFGLAGFSASSGRTLCSMIHGCPASESATVTPASNVAQKKDGCAKSCSAKVETAASVTETKTCAAKASCAGKTCTGKQMVMGAGTAVAMPAAFYANSECKDLQAASGCCKSGAKVETAATVTEKSGCSKSCSGAKVENAASVTEKGACAKSCGAKVETAATTTEKSGCCKSGAKVETAASTTEKSGCCKNGAKVEAAAATTEKAACSGEKSACCKSGAKVETAASTTEKKADDGCCKGSGVRADGGACCGKCDGKKVATKNWQPPY